MRIRSQIHLAKFIEVQDQELQRVSQRIEI